MGLFNIFKSKTKAESNYDGAILLAISVFEENPNTSWKEIIQIINQNIKDDQLSLDLYRFIPIAYCRYFLPEVKFPDIYLTIDDKVNLPIRHKFADSTLYATIEKITKTRFASKTNLDKLINILSHSSEFNAINNALNEGSKLGDLQPSPPLFM